ncbi:hypothetical protein EPA93_07795 [Ktedonosporobacter rubrisoli]|uniref:Bacterial transcriptional activator domain-containing protein n=1 Tax=Ktedonosporobacter rubrisoli TaxID=2509675 RepID=A0A4P6JL27_KTERU|nr:BTAD domain-containing putative transcriptional regulator [Ktedonosporobacter rubrisoli]QBD75917.1 hypothetical protein EPA93_07795 [Ktedonosporobacter rubrisoli]
MVGKEDPLVHVSVRLLGIFQVERKNEQDVWEPIDAPAWGSTYARPLFRRLLCTPGRCLSREQLIRDVLPAGRDDVTTDHYLHKCAYKIRQLFGKEAITTSSVSYRLADQTYIWSDLEAAETLMQKAERLERKQALPLLEEACKLFGRGEALEGETGQWHHAICAAVEREKKSCYLALGHIYEQQGMLWSAEKIYRDLAALYPLDEAALCAQLAFLQRAGMRTEAIAYYEQARAYFVEEGLELSAETQRLLKEISHSLPVQEIFAPQAASIPKNEVVLSWMLAQSPGILEEKASIKPEQKGQNMDQSRRDFLFTLGMVSTGLIATQDLHYESDNSSLPGASEASIGNLAIITHQFRAMQRRGDISIAQGLKTHIETIQGTLEITSNEKLRRELWRLLAQTQLIARLNPHKRSDLARLKTLNEMAIAAARNSGDVFLEAAAVGHLAHLYLREYHDLSKASQFFEDVYQKTHICQALRGWIALVMSSIAARQEDRPKCEVLMAEAMDIAIQIPQTPQNDDPYFTDFSILSISMFGGNNWLALGQARKAYEILSTRNIEELSANRQASAFYDLARTYIALGELEEAQKYAFRSIDTALVTGNNSILPRFITLANAIQEKYSGEPHATAIAEYAQSCMPMKGKVQYV